MRCRVCNQPLYWTLLIGSGTWKHDDELQFGGKVFLDFDGSEVPWKESHLPVPDDPETRGPSPDAQKGINQRENPRDPYDAVVTRKPLNLREAGYGFDE